MPGHMGEKAWQGQGLVPSDYKLARAVYYMLKRKVAFDKQRCLNDEGRGVGERDASLDNHGMHLILETL